MIGIEGVDEPLFSASTTKVPADRVLGFDLPKERAGPLRLSWADADGRNREALYDFRGELATQPRILVISEDPHPGVLDTLYRSERHRPDDLAGVDPGAWELIVLESPELAGIQPDLQTKLSRVIEARSGSLLFVADSPRFGLKGANPAMEALLPVTLLPRSLRNLPDMAILLAIDISGSMFGDKLSLAKVTGLETFRGLKPEDSVGLLLFSDTREWLAHFAPAATLTPSPELEPITARGGTELGPALREGMAALAAQASPEKHMILITDGVTKPDDFSGIAEAAKASGITISTFGVGADAQRSLLTMLASKTGGAYYPILSADGIPSLVFEDRMTVARPAFARGRTPVYSYAGAYAGSVTGMAQYTAKDDALVFVANAAGDPLFASKEYGNRAVLFFGSDIRPDMTKDFFARPESLAIVRERLDALFTESLPSICIVESASSTHCLLRADRMVAPVLTFSRPGSPEFSSTFVRAASGLWSAAVALPWKGSWNARIEDRSSVVAGFSLRTNAGFSGLQSGDLEAARELQAGWFVLLPESGLWLFAFFAMSLVSSLVLRLRRRR
jgi:hypothetical protein